MIGNLRVFPTMTAGWIAFVICVLTAYSQQRGGGLPGTETGWSLFQTRCAVCHLNPTVDRAVPAALIREMSPERIYESLMTGSMKEQSQGISDVQKRRIAEFMSGRPLGSSKAGSAKQAASMATIFSTLLRW